MKNAIKNIIVFIILLLSFTIIFTINWVYSTYGNISLEEIMFQIKAPNTDANVDYYFSYAQNALTYIILFTIVSFIAINKLINNRKKVFPKRMKGKHYEKSTSLVVFKKHIMDYKYLLRFITSFFILIISVTYFSIRTDLKTFIEYQTSESLLIENDYINNKNVKIDFPEEKRNLIYIYLESMEATFYSQENGGAYEQSLIEEIEQLAKENIVFSNSDTLKGLYALPGSTWTTGAMTAQSFGIPLKIPMEGNSYGNYDKFLPGAFGIGEILNKKGYKQMLMIGSNAEFGGRDHLYKQHGNYEIYDFYSSIKEGKKTEDDFTWWGFQDSDLFTYAREKITALAEEEQPFNFTMLTADTHSPDGFKCYECPNKYDEHYYNVLACSSRKVVDFIRWIQEQYFYENTTIVVCGDHPSMQPATFDYLNESGYERTVLDIIINPAIDPENTKYKNASTMDMLPTTLASIGATIEGEKIGLGTNLFSNEQTLIDKYGLENVKTELSKRSKFYEQKILLGN